MVPLYTPSNLSENLVPVSRKKKEKKDAHKDPSVAKVKAELEDSCLEEQEQ